MFPENFLNFSESWRLRSNENATAVLQTVREVNAKTLRSNWYHLFTETFPAFVYKFLCEKKPVSVSYDQIQVWKVDVASF